MAVARGSDGAKTGTQEQREHGGPVEQRVAVLGDEDDDDDDDPEMALLRAKALKSVRSV